MTAPDKREEFDDGGDAFPTPVDAAGQPGYSGMTLRDWFAGECQEDDRLVKCIRAMDDRSLEVFALYPDAEREEHLAEIDFENYAELPSEVQKVTRRLEIEARAIARVRYMQADAMIAEKRRREGAGGGE